MADTNVQAENAAIPAAQPLKISTPRGGIAFVHFARYQADNTLAIMLMSSADIARGERYAVATVCLYPPCEHPGEFGVWLKGWSENEGLPNALEAAGVLKRTNKCAPTGYCVAENAELTEAAIAELARQEALYPERFGKVVRS